MPDKGNNSDWLRVHISDTPRPVNNRKYASHISPETSGRSKETVL